MTHHQHPRKPSLTAALTPVLGLLGCILLAIFTLGADAVLSIGKYAMLAAALVAVIIARLGYRRPWVLIRLGLARSWRQVSPALVMLLFIAMVSTMWMLSGVVPTLIEIGLDVLSPTFFLVTSALICALVSIFTGSSWTTIATIGVALQGIGTVMGYADGWTAGAIISGAYFGDKISPLSDTTVLASSSTGVALLDHVRYMLVSTIPSLLIALTVFLSVGLCTTAQATSHAAEMQAALATTFTLTPWALVIPLLTGILIARRTNTYLTLGLSTLMGIAGFVVWQAPLLATITADAGFSTGTFTAVGARVLTVVRTLCIGAEMHTGSQLLDDLATTSGISGMIDTYLLIISATIYGGTLIGTGMLSSITDAITHHLRGLRRMVTATVGTGLFLNTCTGDQYLSIVLNGNIFKPLYRRAGLEPRLLSRTIEDSTSVTSVLIPWNSCGMTQAAVLGVPTLTYLPCCVFNYLSPLMSIFLAYTGISIRQRTTHHSAERKLTRKEKKQAREI